MSYEHQRRVAAETARRNFTRHGLSCHPDPVVRAMYSRCRRIVYRCRTNQPGYEDVDVHAPWKETGGIELMVYWVLDHLAPFGSGESIDRINPFGDYEPANLRRADARMQAANKRRARVSRLVAELEDANQDVGPAWLHEVDGGTDDPERCAALCESTWREECRCEFAWAHRQRC